VEGKYAKDAIVTITAEVPFGKTFSKWTVTNGAAIILINASSATTWFSMPASAVVVSASFVDVAEGDELVVGTKRYKTVTINNKRWMAENLNDDRGACYNGKRDSCNKYGGLYTWEVAKTICPTGWHLPSHEEWVDLAAAAGDDVKAGEKLKAKSGWYVGQGGYGNGTDEFGFAALPGGFYKSQDDSFDDIMRAGYWWTATSYSEDLNLGLESCKGCAVGMKMEYVYSVVAPVTAIPDTRYSVRCVENQD